VRSADLASVHTMARSFVVVACVLAAANGLVPMTHKKPTRHMVRVFSESPEGAIVPVNEETIASSASVSTGVAGLIIGGPVFAVIAAALGNYGSKQDSEVGEVVRGLGKVSLDVFNFVLKLNSKYDISGKASESAASAFESAKAKDSDGTIAKVEDVLSTVSSKVTQANADYDLVEKGKQAIGYAGDLSVKAIDKAIELNSEYKITEKATSAAKDAISKGVDAAKKN